MGRKYNGLATYNGNFTVGMAAPLDNRDVVRRVADLEGSIGVNKYLGQVVYVTGEYVSAEDLDNPTVNENGIVESEVGYYYYKNETAGWVKMMTIEDGGSGSTIPIDTLPIGEANGIAPLDGNTLIPAEYLPSYVDDVVEGWAYTEIVEGYYYNGAFYSDEEHTSTITPKANVYYKDITDTDSPVVYKYDNGSYSQTNATPIFYEKEIVKGYYYNGAFYSDSSHTTSIAPVADKYYQDIDSSVIYSYDTQNEEYEVASNVEPIEGEKSKIYVDLNTDKTYRWSGSIYVEVSNTQVSKSFTSNVAVGGVAKGTTFSTSDSLETILKKILVNLYQPTATNASTSLDLTGTKVIKIGTKTGNYTFSLVGNYGKVTLDGVTQGAYAGSVDGGSLYIGNEEVVSLDAPSPADTPTANGTYTYTVSMAFQGYDADDDSVEDYGVLKQGNTVIEVNNTPVYTNEEKVLSFKGGIEFNKGAKYNDSEGNPSSTLAEFSKKELQSGVQTIEIVCPMYANTTHNYDKDNDVLDEQDLKSKSYYSNTGIELTLQAHKLEENDTTWANSHPYCVQIPSTWTPNKIYLYNIYDPAGVTVSGHGSGWVKVYDKTSNSGNIFVRNTSKDITKTFNGVSVTYHTWYYNIVSPNINPNKFLFFID